MGVETITFDPDGDLIFHLQCPSAVDTANVSSTPTDESLEPLGSDCSADNPQTEVKMLVSSRHMTLASPIFKSMLRGNFQEAQALKSTGNAEIPLPDDDPGPFTILLNIVHGLFSKVPDKRMEGTLSLYVEKIWMPELLSSVPIQYQPDLFLWFDITWVFRMPKQFKQITKLLVKGSPGDVLVPAGTISLMSSTVLAELSLQRQTAMTKMLAAIQHLLDASMASCPISTLEEPEAELSCICTDDGELSVIGRGYSQVKKINACDGMMFGTLLKSAASAGLYPAPTAPYAGLTVENLARDIRKLEIVSMCDVLPRSNRHSYTFPESTHGQKQYLENQVLNCWSEVEGLDLDLYATPR
ncbi:hypothetical protein VTL71DRAFT_12926 [Oculimacula yallundae]|uniref:BTB domain-containing protein n=1 Tax=Oculimacula yallundae TaxID=86028 RepID=A0ABR4CQN5_9HELO